MSFLFLLVGFTFFGLFFTLVVVFQPATLDPSLLLVVFGLALLLSFGLDSIISGLRESLRIRKSAISYKASDFPGKLASSYKYASLAGNALGLVLIIGLVSFLFYIFAVPYISRLPSGPGIRLPSLVVFSAYVSYAVLVHPLLRRVGLKVGRIGGPKTLPTYKISPEGFVIMFKIHQLGGEPRDYTASIRFDELDELRQFNSYYEAKAFLDYSVGPDLKLQFNESVDLYRWAKGTISRPRVYILLDGRRKAVLIKGSNIFYLLSFEEVDVSDLITAFQSFQSHRAAATMNA